MPNLSRQWRARSEVLWTLAGFVGLATLFVIVMDVRFPFWTDREYAARRLCVLDRQSEFPDRPLLVVLGSSRVGTGFVPEELGPVYDAEGRQVSVINFSHLGAGPRMNLVQLHRLLRDGITPSYLLVELMPAHLHHEPMVLSELALADIRVLMRHWDGRDLLGKAAEYRLTAMSRYRVNCLQSLSPTLATGDRISLRPCGGDCDWEGRSNLTDAKRKALYRTIHMQYAESMATWRVDPLLDAAMRELLGLCRERGIHVGIVLFPESSTFRSWYGDGREDCLTEYLHRLLVDEQVSIFDERGAMPDDRFVDPHHLTVAGAKEFTDRLKDFEIRLLTRCNLTHSNGHCSRPACYTNDRYTSPGVGASGNGWAVVAPGRDRTPP